MRLRKTASRHEVALLRPGQKFWLNEHGKEYSTSLTNRLVWFEQLFLDAQSSTAKLRHPETVRWSTTL